MFCSQEDIKDGFHCVGQVSPPGAGTGGEGETTATNATESCLNAPRL